MVVAAAVTDNTSANLHPPHTTVSNPVPVTQTVATNGEEKRGNVIVFVINILPFNCLDDLVSIDGQQDDISNIGHDDGVPNEMFGMLLFLAC